MFSRKGSVENCLSELLEECENCAKSLRDNELDEDHKSRNSTPVTYIPDLPMLKTATKSYTRNIYSEFEEEFKQQFFVSCKLLQSEGTITTYTMIPMKFQDEATVVFNSKDMTITCSCKKYECTGMYMVH